MKEKIGDGERERERERGRAKKREGIYIATRRLVDNFFEKRSTSKRGTG